MGVDGTGVGGMGVSVIVGVLVFGVIGVSVNVNVFVNVYVEVNVSVGVLVGVNVSKVFVAVGVNELVAVYKETITSF